MACCKKFFNRINIFKRKNKEDFYYRVLKYAHEHSAEGFTFEQMFKALYITPSSLFYEMLVNQREELFYVKGSKYADILEKQIRYLKIEAYYRYIEILELREARKFAKTASILSITAILIAAASLFYSIYINALE